MIVIGSRAQKYATNNSIVADLRANTHFQCKSGVHLRCQHYDYNQVTTSSAMRNYIQSIKNPDLYSVQQLNNQIQLIHFYKSQKQLLTADSFPRFLQLLRSLAIKQIQAKCFSNQLYVISDVTEPQYLFVSSIFDLEPVQILLGRPWNLMGYQDYENFKINIHSSQTFNLKLLVPFQLEFKFLFSNLIHIKSEFANFFLNEKLILCDFAENKKSSLALREVVENVRRNTYQFKMRKIWAIVKEADDFKWIERMCDQFVFQIADVQGAIVIFTGTTCEEIMEFVNEQRTYQ
ncbi:Hypothetical_protein [Hexamita inflata]|uniref:Hypothetical_protein n=1 Tax=Hexamita inflata TaxID=28002 RepID=A0AA86R8L9_9EUKA|nr:Hypothetical protein HINF_LOCUS57988 [Hexamita inflata]